MKIIESTNDPRSEYYDLMRRESIPADELMGRRMEIGVVAVLGQLRAKRNWHRIMREWIYADPPATELGEQEWEYFEGRGVMQTPIVERSPGRRAAMSRIKRGWAVDEEKLGRCCARTASCSASRSTAAAATIVCAIDRRRPRPLPDRRRQGLRSAAPLAVIGFYLLGVIGFYFSVGLAAAADMIFHGQRGDRRRRARRRAQPLLARSPAGRRSRPRSAWCSARWRTRACIGQIVAACWRSAGR